ncbi:MATE family efflux transporter, partial [Clostridium perfringens]
MKNLLKDKAFMKTMLTLALPITLQNFITSSLNLVDNLMVGRLGEEAIAAVGLANQYFFIFMLCISGINAGASVFMSQYWGKKDVSNIKKVLGLDITIG